MFSVFNSHSPMRWVGTISSFHITNEETDSEILLSNMPIVIGVSGVQEACRCGQPDYSAQNLASQWVISGSH